MPSSKKIPSPTVDIKVEHDGNRFFVTKKIDPIGNVRNKFVTWRVTNASKRDFYMRIHTFTPVPSVPPPSGTPPLGLGGDDDDDFSNRHCAVEKLVKSGSKGKKFKGRLSDVPRRPWYDYSITVLDRQTGEAFEIDPELQIDDVNPLDHLKPVFVSIGLVSALALAYWWLTRQR